MADFSSGPPSPKGKGKGKGEVDDTQRELTFEEALQRLGSGAEEVSLKFETLSLDKVLALGSAVRGNAALKSLDLADCALGPSGEGGGLPQVEALAAALRGSSVTSLGLRCTGLGDEGVKPVAAVLRETSIRSLDIGMNEIGAEGAQALAQGLTASSVTSLNVSCNIVTDEAVKHLAAALPETSVERLDLQTNGIGVEGVKALAAVLKDSSVTSLDLMDNNVNAECAEVLLEGLHDSPVIEMWVSDFDLGEEIYGQIQAVVEENRARSLILQMQVQKTENEVEMKLRTVAGQVAAVLMWSLDRPVEDLPEAVLTSIRRSGFQLPFKGLSAVNLKLVRPDGATLDAGAAAPSLAQQLGIDS